MTRPSPILLLCLFLAGCASEPQAGPESPPAPAAFVPCLHPWPCADGSEWPVGLVGPFDLLEPEHVRIASFDGVELDGWVWRPALPDGVRAPVVIKSTPYLGTCSFQSISDASPSCSGTGGSEMRLEGSARIGEIVAEGYAYLLASVRGTGASGGCFDLWGPTEQRDQVVLVEWAAAQPWSNGRVAMAGISYEGTTPWEAAIQDPPALKAILVGGIITDVYLSLSTPQGAIQSGYDVFQVGTTAANSFEPPVGEVPGMIVDWAPGSYQRACPGSADILTVNSMTATMDERPADWFADRRLVDRFRDVEAAVLVAHGLLDNNFHRFQEDTIWPHLDGPAWFVLGQWGHTFGFDEQLAGFAHGGSWLDFQLAWLDFWLKGLGQPPRMGVVDYQDSAGGWHSSTAWPPAEATQEALFLADGLLAPAPGSGAASFRALPQPATNRFCPSMSPQAPSLVYVSPPLERAAVVAGNPFALLELESDQPGGVIEVELVRVPAGYACDEDPPEFAEGAVDLRFHAGGLMATPFPTGVRTVVRVDLFNHATRFEPGDRIGLVVGNPADYETRGYAPAITVHGASHLVLPLVEGTLGGAVPLTEYPPRPFA